MTPQQLNNFCDWATRYWFSDAEKGIDHLVYDRAPTWKSLAVAIIATIYMAPLLTVFAIVGRLKK